MPILLQQALRKFELFKKAFPCNAPLLKCLKTELDQGSSMILWFRHNEQCHISDFYTSRKHVKKTGGQIEDSKLKCANCSKTEGEILEDGTKVELKRCLRCKKVWYCSRECQKTNYSLHKRYCHAVY